MKIKRIKLYNFGSYEGACTFDLSTDKQEKRIVVIGGKNGSGKTTFFNAIQLCLYGNFAFGYKHAGKLYLKEVYNLINYNARIKENDIAYITIEFQHAEARDLSEYQITRQWSWSTGNLEEAFIVHQNGEEMNEEDLHTFQNYLIHLIPPDMLKLYFFDGEKIADYFLSDATINIREALMILSGKDTFDILHKNVRRVINLNKDADTDVANRYVAAQEEYSSAERDMNNAQSLKASLLEQLAFSESQLEQSRAQYAARGGLTLDQWNDLQQSLKAEESNRERINWQRKSDATDILPFIILHELTSKVAPQITSEDNYTSHQILKSKLAENSFRKSVMEALNKAGVESKQSVDNIFTQISRSLLPKDWEGFTPIFQLSNDEKIQVQVILNKVSVYNSETLKTYQQDIEKSLKKAKSIRSTIKNSDIEHIEEYIKETTELEGELKLTKEKLDQTEIEILRHEESVHNKEKLLTAAHKALESTLKKESVAAVSGRVLLLIEDLQREIYSELIRKVEVDLKSKFRQLIRKQNFFDDIKIDSDFNVHIIKNQMVSTQDLILIVRKGGKAAIAESMGELAAAKIFSDNENKGNRELIKHLENLPVGEIELPVEIDKESMSSGEKQIFVMSLYWALMQQSNNELPFIIDTPFARIDTEHRANITQYFFLELTGQLFILSTNEELDKDHLKMMKDKVANIYTLEYGKDKRTMVYNNTYFEVKNGF